MMDPPRHHCSARASRRCCWPLVDGWRGAVVGSLAQAFAFTARGKMTPGSVVTSGMKRAASRVRAGTISPRCCWAALVWALSASVFCRRHAINSIDAVVCSEIIIACVVAVLLPDKIGAQICCWIASLLPCSANLPFTRLYIVGCKPYNDAVTSESWLSRLSLLHFWRSCACWRCFLPRQF